MYNKKMNPEVKAQWLTALRSGEYAQGSGSLNEDGKFCCLGVLCDLAERDGVVERVKVWDSGVFGYTARKVTGVLPWEVRDWSGLKTVTGDFYDDSGAMQALTILNDGGMPFVKIADIIEQYF